MNENFTNNKHNHLVAAAAQFLNGRSQLNEDLKPAKTPLARKAIEAVANCDQDEMEDFLYSFHNHLEFGERDNEINDVTYDEVSKHILNAAKVWKERFD